MKMNKHEKNMINTEIMAKNDHKCSKICNFHLSETVANLIALYTIVFRKAIPFKRTISVVTINCLCMHSTKSGISD